MADNDVPETADPGTEPSEGVSVSKRPTGKSRKKPADSASNAPTMEAAAPASSAGSAKPGKQITVSVSALRKAAIAALLIALIVVAGVFGWMWSSERAERIAGNDARDAAAYYMKAVFDSMNATAADGYVDRVAPLQTGELKKNTIADRDKTQQAITELKFNVNAEVKYSALIENTKDAATVLVLSELTGTSTVATQPVTNTGMFIVNLEKHDGKWLVANTEQGPGTEAGMLPGGGEAPTVGVPAPGGEAPAPVPTEPAPAPAPAG